ncbi:hypothetical protein [Cellulosimicrobium protaetiae]|uniref:Uncharacterized protein n=1 Tax=Cellulosimicrobium protaetiae TaxID=2587808 RepID=A0A6M5UEH9_9MICO|nr:hypothetical protein [Cellulosimicrobium protaetiae]QJW36987.1 hypothetical protein FIC82_013140 [Cellulosimicrobium protaetiae]
MSWDWVPPRPGEEDGSDGGPSRALRRAVTVLVVLLTGVLAVYYVTVWLGQQADACVADRPAGVSAQDVDARWGWFPPGYTCEYATAVEDVARA